MYDGRKSELKSSVKNLLMWVISVVLYYLLVIIYTTRFNTNLGELKLVLMLIPIIITTGLLFGMLLRNKSYILMIGGLLAIIFVGADLFFSNALQTYYNEYVSRKDQYEKYVLDYNTHIDNSNKLKYNIELSNYKEYYKTAMLSNIKVAEILDSNYNESKFVKDMLDNEFFYNEMINMSKSELTEEVIEKWAEESTVLIYKAYDKIVSNLICIAAIVLSLWTSLMYTELFYVAHGRGKVNEVEERNPDLNWMK